MIEDRTASLFFELFSGLPRQGPGDQATTLRALACVPDVGPATRVLDIGCGTGMQTRVLARHSAAHIVAVDSHAPYVEELTREAQAHGLADRIDARVGDMQSLDFPPGSFDVIWCEGAIYVIGLETGLREWRRLLVPGGHLVLTEVCWTKPDPPQECLAFWSQEYPAIRDVSARLDVMAQNGYQTVDHFPMPRSAWWDDYYGPLARNIRTFLARHAGEPDAQQLADQVQREIDIWHAYSDFYAYEFFVMRALPRPPSSRLVPRRSSPTRAGRLLRATRLVYSSRGGYRPPPVRGEGRAHLSCRRVWPSSTFLQPMMRTRALDEGGRSCPRQACPAVPVTSRSDASAPRI